MKFYRIALLSLAVALLAGCGNSSSPTNTDGASLDPAPPAAPTGLKVIKDQGTKQRYLAWDASSTPNVAGYEVFAYDPNPNRLDSYVYLDYTGETRWSLATVTFSSPKSFRVRTVTQGGKRSSFTSDLTVDPVTYDPVPPPEPTAPPKHQQNIE